MAKPEAVAEAAPMRIRQVFAMMQTLLLQQVNTFPVFLWSPPGCGKSQVFYQVVQWARKHLASRDKDPWHMIDFRAANHDPTDITGVPAVVDGVTVWFTPKNFALPPDWKGLIFLDELPQAAKLMQSGLLQLVLDRKVGNHELPEQAYVVAAGNRVQDGCGSNVLIASQRARFTHVDLQVDTEDWLDWAQDADIHGGVLAYHRWLSGGGKGQSKALFQFDSNERVTPNPRAWSRISTILKTFEDDLWSSLIAGTIGAGAASEFATFLRVYQELPRMEDMPKYLKTQDPPPRSKPDVLYAVCGAIAEWCRKQDASDLDIMFGFARKMSREFQVMLIKDAVRTTGGKVIKCKEGRDWLKANPDLI